MLQAIPTRSFLGYSFAALSADDLCRILCQSLEEGGQIRIFTPNPEMLTAAESDPSLRVLLQQADLLLPDGIGITLGSRLCGAPLPFRLPGIDLAERLLCRLSQRGERVFFLGGREGIAERAAKAWEERFPTLSPIGFHHGYFDRTPLCGEQEEVLSQIRAFRPRILLVCMGFPVQEQWITDLLPSLPSVGLAMGLGGTLDVWSGEVRRAPLLLRRCGLEWLWRSAQLPCRWRRLTCLPRFLLTVIREGGSVRQTRRSDT